MKISDWMNRPIFTGWAIVLIFTVAMGLGSVLGVIGGLVIEDHFTTAKESYVEGWNDSVFMRQPKYDDLDVFKQKKRVTLTYGGMSDEGLRQVFEGQR
jgi:hypothetical protein